MRIRFKPTAEQRASLRARMARLQQGDAALGVLRSVLPAGFEPVGVTCTRQSLSPDRFVLRAEVRSDRGEERLYALKGYSDEFGERVWAHAQALPGSPECGPDDLCLPQAYVPGEFLLVFPWVDGAYLSEIIDDRKPGLLQQAARIAARLHRRAIVPEPCTTPATLLEETRGRCDRLRSRWPEGVPLVDPLLTSLEKAAFLLDPAEPAPVHGDLAAGQFLWTGERLVLLDLDMFGYSDPAYDVGHFLAQLERRCVTDDTVRIYADAWLRTFQDAYLAAMPTVSVRNISFYWAMTLIRKIYTLSRRRPVEVPELGPRLAARARAALDRMMAPE